MSHSQKEVSFFHFLLQYASSLFLFLLFSPLSFFSLISSHIIRVLMDFCRILSFLARCSSSLGAFSEKREGTL